MNTFQSTISSPRNQRILFWVGLLALAAGVVVLIVKFVGGSDPTPIAPDKGFKAQLPAKTQPLTNGDGVKVTSYEQLDPQIKEAIRGFVVPGVMNGNYGASWKYTSPKITHGATLTQWANANARSRDPVAWLHLRRRAIHAQGGDDEGGPRRPALAAGDAFRRPARACSGSALVPSGQGADKRWLVDYWMPRLDAARPAETDRARV